MPVLANVLRLRISVLRPVDKPVDKLIRQFDRVANGVELAIQFVVRIYGHNQNGDQEPCNRVQEKIVPKSVCQFRDQFHWLQFPIFSPSPDAQFLEDVQFLTSTD